MPYIQGSHAPWKSYNVKIKIQNGVGASSETQGQIAGARESLNERQNMARRKVKNGEKSPWGQCLTRPVPNGRRRSAFWLVPENFCVFLFFLKSVQKRVQTLYIREYKSPPPPQLWRGTIAPCKVIQDSLGFWIPWNGFRIPGTGFQSLSVKLGFWIPWAAFGIPNPRIPEFTSKTSTVSGFHKQKFSIFQNPDSLTRDDKKIVQVLEQHTWTLPVVQHQGNNTSLHQQKISPQRGKLSSSWCRDMHSKLLLPLSRQPWAELL